VGDAKAGFKENFEAALGALKSIIVITLGLSALAFLWADFNPICAASQKLLERAGSTVTVIKIPGIVEVNLSPENVAAAALVSYSQDQVADYLKSRRADAAAAAIAKLEPEEFARLMAVGTLDKPCEYEHPTAQMRSDLAVDYWLQEKGLVLLETDDKARTDAIADLDGKRARGEAVAIGNPRTCYGLTLTDVGRDVKTWFVTQLKSAFNPSRGRGEPPTDSNKMAAR
jgi:hypothetical protein